MTTTHGGGRSESAPTTPGTEPGSPPVPESAPEQIAADGSGGPDEQDAVAPRIGFSVDGIVDGEGWPEHAEALSRWKQGHLLTDVPLTWIAPPGEDALTGLTQSEAETGPLWWKDTFDAIICSQTCDIGSGPPGGWHPTVLVAPLVHQDGLRSNSRRNLAAQGKLGYLVQVLPAQHEARQRLIAAVSNGTGPGASDTAGTASDTVSLESLSTVTQTPRGHRWYADLRLLVPVSKALLLDRDPVEGFVNERESLAFSEQLAQKFRRPALHEALSEELPDVIEDFVRNTGSSKQCFAKVEQVRLLITEGDRLNPTRGQLLVLTAGGALSESEVELWAGLNKNAAAVFSRHGIAYAPVVHHDVSTVSVPVYRQAVPVRCSLLGPVRWP